MMNRTEWPTTSHEHAVERFYSHGVHARTDIHQGFLNFGLWEEGIEDYVAAAHNLVHRLGTMLGLAPGSHLLDVACGMGSQDVYLRRTFGAVEIEAMDVTWQHVARAVQRSRDEGLEAWLRVHHGSATSLPFADATFTHVMSIEGAETDTRRRSGEALRVLRPGGVLCLADYTVRRTPRSALERAVFGATCRLWHVPRANLWATAEYRRQLVAAGFDEVSLDEVSALTFPGYYREQCRPAFRREMRRLQGWLLAELGQVINVVMNQAYLRGLIDYAVRAVARCGRFREPAPTQRGGSL
jgi:ubiquinone/menaquinone biosynthesis C-methylase UbiE